MARRQDTQETPVRPMAARAKRHQKYGGREDQAVGYQDSAAGGMHDKQSYGFKDEKDEKDEKNDKGDSDFQKHKNIQTARDGTQGPKSREFETAASHRTHRKTENQHKQSDGNPAGDPRVKTSRTMVSTSRKVAAIDEERGEQEADSEEVVWWGPPGRHDCGEGEPEEELHHPGKWWQEGGEMVEDSASDAVSKDKAEARQDGLSQDGLRPDPLNRKSKEPEVRTARSGPLMFKPTKREIEEHNKHHCPFQPWCEHCVRGRATNVQHRRKKDEAEEDVDNKVPRISMDYFFMSRKDEEAKENPVLGMVDESTGDKYARATGQKGLGKNGEMDWLIQDMVNELRAWGHTGGPSGHIIMKSDNENSIKAVRDAVGRLLGGRVVPEGPPKGESQSNGRVEEAGKTIIGFARVLKDQLEKNAKVEILGSDVITQWLIRWAAMVPSRFLVGKDGKTAYERRRGRKCEVHTERFGESVWYRELKTKVEKQDKADSNWHRGLWLGHASNSNESIVGTKDGVVKAWAIRRMPVGEQWDASLIKTMQGTPQRPDPRKPSLSIPVSVSVDIMQEDESGIYVETARREAMPRSPHIRQWMLDEFGYTDGCQGCDFKKAGMSAQRPHNQKCRDRMEIAMEKDERGRRAKAAAKDRFDHWAALEMEENDKKEAQRKMEENQQKDEAKAEQASEGQPEEDQAPPEQVHQDQGEDEENDPDETKDEENKDEENKDDKDDKNDEDEDRKNDKKRNRGAIEQQHGDKRRRMPETRVQKRLRADSESEINKKFREEDFEDTALLQLHPANMSQQSRMEKATGICKRRLDRRAWRQKVENQQARMIENKAKDEMENKVRKLLKIGHADRIRDHTGKEVKKDDWHEDGVAAWDDITGVGLDASEVRKARMTEIGYAKKKHVWRKITRAESMRRGWKVIKTRWIDINKGDNDNMIYRSRLVAKEFNTGEVEGLFAGTPPLESLRMLVSDAASLKKGFRRKCIMINDVSRAFFEAPMQRNVCIELPDEDLDEKDRGKDMVGHLRMSLYGTRDAAANFQHEVKKFMKSNGFTVGLYNPCTYHHKGWQLKCLVHGDDFVTSGDRSGCDWLRKRLESRFEIKTKIVGHGGDEVREERILNRVIRATEKGWELEADQRHVDIIVEQLNLKEANPVKTPGEEEQVWEIEGNSEPLDEASSRKYRELAARANYLAQDRMDIQFATKEVCRGMCQPTKGNLKKLRRLGRYLKGHPRTVMAYKWQGQKQSVQGYSDSDFAGCRKTAKSTSGGVIMFGDHYIKSWSSTQKTVALSSGEAELTALVKCSCEVLGVVQLAADWGEDLEGEVLVDSSAALGVVARIGAGKLRHVRVGQLWVQQKNETGELNYKKIKGTSNPADLMTKSLVSQDIVRYMGMAGQELRLGRASKGLQLSTDTTKSANKLSPNLVSGFRSSQLVEQSLVDRLRSKEECETYHG